MIRRFVAAAAVTAIASLSGCYSNSVRDAPSQNISDIAPIASGFAAEVADLTSRCNVSESLPLVGQERLFDSYLTFLNSCSGKTFAGNLEIVPDGTLDALVRNGVLTFLDGGVFWYGNIRIRNKGMSLSSLTHEYGHSTDAHLSYTSYLTSSAERVRAEACAESFRHYIGLELLAQDIPAGEKFLIAKPDLFAPEETLGDMIARHSRYDSANVVALLLMNDQHEMRRVWTYLATHDLDQTNDQIAAIIASHRTIHDALDAGWALTVSELNRKRIKQDCPCLSYAGPR